MLHTTVVGYLAEWRAVCIERCMHGSGGGAGASSKEASRAHPTRPARGSAETGAQAAVEVERGRTDVRGANSILLWLATCAH